VSSSNTAERQLQGNTLIYELYREADRPSHRRSGRRGRRRRGRGRPAGQRSGEGAREERGEDVDLDCVIQLEVLLKRSLFTFNVDIVSYPYPSLVEKRPSIPVCKAH
jgi:hypothetical protein